jgi:geranyl-CoA carboxylase beta subunit
MGGEQAAQTMVNVTEAAMRRKGGEVDRAKLAEMERRIIDRFDSQMSVFTTSARMLDDAVIDPRDTREVLARVLSICRDAELRQPQPMQFAVARP